MVTNILQRDTTQLSFLDGVEPDAWISEIRCIGPEYGKRLYGKLPIQSLQSGYYVHSKLYSRETVEALLEAQRAEYEARIDANRKEVLLEAADRCGKLADAYDDNAIKYPESGGHWTVRSIGADDCKDGLRRMALEPTGVDKGEG
jgi:hypothetical protein